MFVSLFYGRLDLASGEMVYVNAGHNPPLLLRAERCSDYDRGICSVDEAFAELTRTGMVLGIEETAQYGEERVQLNPGDLIVLYTDGLIEMLDAQGQEFGLERLQDLIIGHRGAPAMELASALTDTVRAWAALPVPGGAAARHAVALHDDVTVVVIRRSSLTP